MVDDVFSVTVNVGCPDSHAMFTFWYRENLVLTSSPFGTTAIAQAFANRFDGALRAFMSDDFQITSYFARKHFRDPEPRWRERNPIQGGLRPGPGLPANKCLVISLNQGTFSAKSNGRVYIPGIPESETLVGVINSAQQLLVQNFLDLLILPLPEPTPGTGEWTLGVVSRNILHIPDLPPDWLGSFAPVISVAASPIIYSQKRRTTRIIGQSI